MGKNLMKIIGLAQGALGALGTAAPAAVGTAIQTTQGGSLFNRGGTRSQDRATCLLELIVGFWRRHDGLDSPPLAAIGI